MQENEGPHNATTIKILQDELGLLLEQEDLKWKACHDLLPTRQNLAKRKIIDSPLCPICEREAETVKI